MHIRTFTKFSLVGFVLGSLIAISTVNAQSSIDSSVAQSCWVYKNSKGKLVYKKLPAGDKILDFSYAGYMGGGVSIPVVEAKVTLGPIEGDNTEAIQRAIDQVSKMQLVNGFRGAVVLKAGIYNCAAPITINESGIVLRGSGAGDDGTIINMTGDPHVCISVRNKVAYNMIGAPVSLADNYVPSGAMSFDLSDASDFRVGDTIRIVKPVTTAWITFMGMDQLVRNGKKQTWITGEITCDRVIRAKHKNKITIDVPLTDNYNSKYLNPPGVSVVKISSVGELSHIGIEDMRIVCPPQSVTINQQHHRAFILSGVADGWARNIDVMNTVNSITVTGKRITVEKINISHKVPTIGAAKPADINGSGPQLLFDHCTITGDNVFFFATGAKVTGPIVLLNCIFHGNGWIQPHQRWATGLLVDNCEVPDGGIDFMNRGEMGSGHGWAIGWAVAWNCKAKSFINQMPPGAANWVIGSFGQKEKKAIPFDKEPMLPEGIYDSYETPVVPKSLYLSQLKERLGDNALKDIGY